MSEQRDPSWPEPYVDPVLGIEHGERSRLNDDPPPYDGTCLCGHPDYMLCPFWPEGGIAGLTLSRGPNGGLEVRR